MEGVISSVAGINKIVNDFVWGPGMLLFLVLTGVYFTIGTGFFQIRRFKLWFGETFIAIFRNKAVTQNKDPNAISQFQALSTALAGTIGTGNIVGVATALTAGGPGAIFWMWISSFFGMMTNYAENVLGIRYRYKNEKGAWIGGPMVYLERGLGCKGLAVLFACLCVLASLGMGNMTQANSIAGALKGSLNLSPLVTGVIVAILVSLVILGGIKRIGKVAERFVPFMAVFYILGGIALIILHRENVPDAFRLIFSEAFDFRCVGGGIGGYIMSNAVRYGIARGVFTNEAGLGTSCIVHSASNVTDPAKQGMWGMFEVFFDTIIMCTITAVAMLSSGVVGCGADGVELAMAAFETGFGEVGKSFITIAILFFAFATMLGWSYYGERAVEYLFGSKHLIVYRVVFILAIILGCVAKLELVWDISDTFNGLMAIPNLVGLIFLSGDVFHATKNYLKKLKNS